MQFHTQQSIKELVRKIDLWGDKYCINTLSSGDVAHTKPSAIGANRHIFSA